MTTKGGWLMSAYPRCDNCGRDSHPYYQKKYGGICLDCSNAGVGELRAQLAALVVRADAAERERDRLQILRECDRFQAFKDNAALVRADAAQPTDVEREADDGKVRSFLRNVLVRGASIQQDYAAGHYASYEVYSAHLNVAARELAAEMPRGGF
jgi:hypothetical protein